MNLLPFNDFDLKTPGIFEALNETSRSLAELKGFANSIPNQHILINAITINEAKGSSEIENIVTTHDSIYKVLVELQGMIEHNQASVRKNPGTKLVNSKTGEVIYTPPQEEKEIRDLLSHF